MNKLTEIGFKVLLGFGLLFRLSFLKLLPAKIYDYEVLLVNETATGFSLLRYSASIFTALNINPMLGNRYLIALAGVASIYLAYKIALLFFDNKIYAYLVALLLCFSPVFLMSGRWGFDYHLVPCFSLLFFYSILKINQLSRYSIYDFWLIFSVFILLLVHPASGLFGGAAAVTLFILSSKNRSMTQNLSLLIGVFLVVLFYVIRPKMAFELGFYKWPAHSLGMYLGMIKNNFIFLVSGLKERDTFVYTTRFFSPMFGMVWAGIGFIWLIYKGLQLKLVLYQQLFVILLAGIMVLLFFDGTIPNILHLFSFLPFLVALGFQLVFDFMAESPFKRKLAQVFGFVLVVQMVYFLAEYIIRYNYYDQVKY